MPGGNTGIQKKAQSVRYQNISSELMQLGKKGFDPDQVRQMLDERYNNPTPMTEGQMEKWIGGAVSRFSMSSVKRSKDEARAGRELSMQARGKMIDELVGVATLSDGTFAPLGRLFTFVRRGENNEIKQYNHDLLEAVKSEDWQRIHDVIWPELERSREAAGINSLQDLEALYEISDEELIQRYESISRYLRLMGESENIIADKRLMPEETQQLSELSPLALDLLQVVERRMDIIANPYYERIDPTTLYGKLRAGQGMALEGEIEDYLPDDDPRTVNEQPLNNYFSAIAEYTAHRGDSVMVRAAVRDSSLVGAVFNADHSTCSEMLGQLQPLVAYTNTGECKVITNGVPMQIKTAPEHTKELSDLAIQADKWLLTGSKQFAQMQKELKELKELNESQGTLSRDRLIEKTNLLVAAATEYLAYKGIKAPYDSAAVLNKGKNQREQSRLDVACGILAFAAAQSAALDRSIVVENEAQFRNRMLRSNAELIQTQAGELTTMRFNSIKINTGVNLSELQADQIDDDLGKEIANQLKQVNERLKGFREFNDGFCANALCAQELLKLMEDPKVMEVTQKHLDPEDIRTAKAGVALGQLREKGLESEKALRERLSRGETTRNDAMDLANYCQLCNIAKSIADGKLDLTKSPYGAEGFTVEEVSSKLEGSHSLGKILEKKPKQRLEAMQEITNMARLGSEGVKDKISADAAKARDEKRTKETVEKIKDHDPQKIDGFFEKMQKDLTGRQKEDSPISKEDFALLSAMACGSGMVSYKLQGGKQINPASDGVIQNNPDQVYPKMIRELYEPKVAEGDTTSAAAKSMRDVRNIMKAAQGEIARDIQNKDYTRLGKVLAGGLKQHVKMLDGSKYLNDEFCAYGRLGGRVLQLLEKTPELKTEVMKHLDKFEINTLKAGAELAELRAKGMQSREQLAQRFGKGESSPEDGKDLANICQMCGIANMMSSGRMLLKISPYGKDGNVCDTVSNTLKDNPVLSQVLEKSPEEKAALMQDFAQMGNLYKATLDKKLGRNVNQNNNERKPQIDKEVKPKQAGTQALVPGGQGG